MVRPCKEQRGTFEATRARNVQLKLCTGAQLASRAVPPVRAYLLQDHTKHHSGKPLQLSTFSVFLASTVRSGAARQPVIGYETM
jgi:hypothetical protein